MDTVHFLPQPSRELCSHVSATPAIRVGAVTNEDSSSKAARPIDRPEAPFVQARHPHCGPRSASSPVPLEPSFCFFLPQAPPAVMSTTEVPCLHVRKPRCQHQLRHRRAGATQLRRNQSTGVHVCAVQLRGWHNDRFRTNRRRGGGGGVAGDDERHRGRASAWVQAHAHVCSGQGCGEGGGMIGAACV